MKRWVAIFLIIVLLLIGVYCWFKGSDIPWISFGETVTINKRVWKALNKALIYPTRDGVAKFAEQPDAQNITLHNELWKKYGRVAKTFIGWQPVVIINSSKVMRDILYDSPELYGPGNLKRCYFCPFMANNVGINYYPQWNVNRPFNEKVLGFHSPDHPLYKLVDRKSPLIISKLSELVNKDGIMHGEDFISLGRYVSYLVTFGERYANPEYYPYVWDLLKATTDWKSIIGFDPVSSKVRHKYLNFMNYQLVNPEPDSLMNYVHFRTQRMRDVDVIDQVPHWVFPLSNAMFNILTAYLALLQVFPDVRSQVQSEINTGVNTESIDTWLHWSIMETIRMYGIVITLTRTSIKDQTVTDEADQQYHLSKGDQILMLTAVLSNDPKCFPNSSQWIPHRWKYIPNDSFCDVIFNIGPQMCPGKNLIQYLLKSIVKELLLNYNFMVTPKLDPKSLPAALNPWDIKVQFSPIF